jgi:hypothetical protein
MKIIVKKKANLFNKLKNENNSENNNENNKSQSKTRHLQVQSISTLWKGVKPFASILGK